MTLQDERLQLLGDIDLEELVRRCEFDAFAQAASTICGTPHAMVTVITDKEQCNLGRCGIDVETVELDYSFCRVALAEQRVLVIEDASKDEMFCNNPFVTGDAHVRFYAGIPILYENRVPLGTICVFDDKPRSLSLEERAKLMQVVCQLEDQLHSALRAMNRTTTHTSAQPRQLALSYLDELRDSLAALRHDPRAADLTAELEELSDLARHSIDVLTNRPNATAVEIIHVEKVLGSVCDSLSGNEDVLPVEIIARSNQPVLSACNPSLIREVLVDSIEWLSDRAEDADSIKATVVTDETRAFVVFEPWSLDRVDEGHSLAEETSNAFSSHAYSSLRSLDNTMERVCQLMEIQGGNVRVGWQNGALNLRVELPNLNAVG